jgi:hypothetical protein
MDEFTTHTMHLGINGRHTAMFPHPHLKCKVLSLFNVALPNVQFLRNLTLALDKAYCSYIYTTYRINNISLLLQYTKVS